MARRVLDIGCGWNKQPGAIGMDVAVLPTVDVVHDIDEMPFPFRDDTFEEIHLVHVVEHARSIVRLLEEIHRICRPGARVRIVTPHYTDSMSWQDPTHRWHLNSYSFRYFDPTYRGSYYTSARFRVVSRHVSMARLWKYSGIEFLVNADGRWRFARFLRRFWEQYLSFLMRGKHMTFVLECVKVTGRESPIS